MTEEEKLLTDFTYKVRQLMDSQRKLKSENAALKKLLQEKEEAFIKLENNYEELKSSYANLKQVRIISINDSELKSTKQRLSRLVREVDKCISLLNE